MSEYIYRGLFWIVMAVIAVYCGYKKYKKSLNEKESQGKVMILFVAGLLAVGFMVLSVLTFMKII